MTLLVKNLNLTYSVVGKILPMKCGSSLFAYPYILVGLCALQYTKTENYTQIVMCKNVDSRVVLMVS